MKKLAAICLAGFCLAAKGQVTWPTNFGSVLIMSNAMVQVVASNSPAVTESSVTNALGTSVEKLVFLASSVTNSATNYADVTGLSFTTVSNKHYVVFIQVGYSGVGSGWALNGGGTPTEFAVRMSIPSTSSTTSDYSVSGWDLPTARTTSGATSGNVVTIVGGFKAATNGTVTVRFASKTAGAAIVTQPGSMLKWVQTD